MSKERSVVGTVILTVLVTLIVIGGAGWFGWQRYLSQQVAIAPPEAAAPAPTPAPRRKAAQQTTASTSTARADSGTASDPAASKSAATPESDAARPREDSESASAAGRGATPPAAEAEAARPREENEAPTLAAKPLAPASGENRDDARAVMEETQRRTEARSYQYDGLLQAFDTKDKISEKRWTYMRMGSHGQSKAVVRFTTPAEVKGVALLIFNHPERASDQWMWTPAIERDRRIALQDRSTRFFGTDFSFEDLEERDVNQFEFTLDGDDSIDGAPCWRLRSTPKEAKSSQYTRSIVWIRKDRYTFERFENYIKDQVVRRLTYSDYQNVQGIWTARQLEMADLRRGSRTRLTLDKLAYNVPFKDEDFTLPALRRQ